MVEESEESLELEGFDPATYVDQSARMLNLPIDPEYRPGVIDNLARIESIAQLFLEFPLSDDIVAAPVFDPTFQP